ncbi:hypothetical protein P9112_011477 [Eukaryota sp. TZLM1-RC]
MAIYHLFLIRLVKLYPHCLNESITTDSLVHQVELKTYQPLHMFFFSPILVMFMLGETMVLTQPCQLRVRILFNSIGVKFYQMLLQLFQFSVFSSELIRRFTLSETPRNPMFRTLIEFVFTEHLSYLNTICEGHSYVEGRFITKTAISKRFSLFKINSRL